MQTFSKCVFLVASCAEAPSNGFPPYVELRFGDQKLSVGLTAALNSDNEIDGAVDRLISRLEILRGEAKDALRLATENSRCG